MSRPVKSFTKSVLYYTGYYRLKRAFDPIDRNRLLILMYHDLRDDRSLAGSFDPTLGAQEFEAHVCILTRMFRVMTVEDAVNEIAQNGCLKEPSAAITFDDGYVNVYRIAFPILKRLGVSATTYLPTDWINGAGPFWWMRLKAMIASVGLTDSNIDAILDTLGVEPSGSNGETFDAGCNHRDFLAGIESQLRTRSDSEVRRSLQELPTRLGISESEYDGEQKPMSWDQIREMCSAGMRFGAHTVSHANLSHMTFKEAENEILSSRNEIESKINQPVVGFAYPYGNDLDCYKNFKNILEANGFTYAVTARYGNNDQTGDRYLLRRSTLPSSPSRSHIGRILHLDYLASA